jgi:hypothetical protein
MNRGLGRGSVDIGSATGRHTRNRYAIRADITVWFIWDAARRPLAASRGNPLDYGQRTVTISKGSADNASYLSTDTRYWVLSNTSIQKSAVTFICSGSLARILSAGLVRYRMGVMSMRSERVCRSSVRSNSILVCPICRSSGNATTARRCGRESR